MKNVFIINAHQPYPFSEGRLNKTLVERASQLLTERGYNVRTTTMTEEHDVDREIENHRWADTVIVKTTWAVSGAKSR